jgi:hypothetical protein
MATKAEIDRYIKDDLFADASPLVGRKRGHKQAAEAATATWTPADIAPATTRSRPAAKRAARETAELAAKRRAQPSDG